MGTVRLHNTARNTTALGPGLRAAIWFQGCNRRCKGCMTPDSRPLDGGYVKDVDELYSEIRAINNIEGITISGGEPFLQIQALYDLLSKIRSETDLGVIIYTGNTMDQLKGMQDPLVDEIITSLADIIIDGEYVDELNDGGSLKGSSNQVVNYITDRYKEYEELYNSKKRNIQVIIDKDKALLIGIPDRKTLETWKLTTELLKGE